MCNQSLTLNTLYVKTLAIALWSTKTKFLINTKQTNMKKLFSILVVLVAALVWNNVSAQIIIPAGNITTNTNWTNNNVYILDGFVYVKSGATLTIQPGTIIKGAKTPDGSALGFRVGTLIIEPGAKIIANGTETQPIIFTSQKPAGIDPNTSQPYRAPGDWGGLVICGYGAVNIPGGIGTAEGGLGTQYGWGLAGNPFGNLNANSNTDSSGILRYVRVEFPGIPLTTQSNSEINGITFYGVGNKTVVEHVQVSFSGDDAFEWFGGAVNGKYLIALGTWDDDFDTDLGFSGKIQFAVAQRYSAIADQSGSNGFESDNDNLNSPQGSSNTPFTQPIFSNVSWFGPYPTVNFTPTPNALHQSAMHLRRNTKTSIYNSFFAGGEEGLRLDGTGTQTNYTSGDLQLEQVTITGWKIDSLRGANSSVASTILGIFNTSSNNNGFFADNAALNLNPTAFNTVNFSNATLVRPDFRPQSNSVLLTGANAAVFTNARLQDPFFTPVNYRGAFGTSDWTTCWSEFNPFAQAYNATLNTAVTVNVTAGGVTTFCAGDVVNITSTLGGNSNGTSYVWSNGSTTQNIAADATGSYNVTVTNANGCSATAPNAVSVTVNSLPAAPTVSSTGNATSFCFGDDIELTSSYANGNVWSNGATTQSITVNSAASFTVTHTDGNGCTSNASSTFTTSVNPLPAAPQITANGNTSFCIGDDVELTSSYATGNVWSNAATTQSITVNTSGSFTVTHTDANGCSATSGAISTSSGSAPSPTVSVSGSTNFCTGGSVQLTASQGDSYLWSPSGETTQSITATTAGNYTVSVTNANPCDGAGTSAAVTVTVTQAPTPTIIAGGVTTFCDGGSVVLTSELANGYNWSNGATTQSVTVDASGTYTVTVTNTNTCLGAGSSNTINVTVNDNPVAEAAIASINGLAVTFENTSTDATKYEWNFGDNGGASLAAEPTYTYGVAGEYTVTLTVENANGCSDVTTLVVSVSVGIEEKDAFNSIKLYPNPTANYATLSMDLINNSDVHVLVFDLAGKLVHDIKNERLFAGEHQVKIDMTGLNNGLYLVTIKADKAVVSKRLVVNK